MSQIPQDIIERVRDSADIVDVVSKYVDLKQRGPNYFGLCPFHNEKTPSFSVSPTKQIYYCFGCNAGGNVYSFLMDYQKIPFPDAVKVLAEQYNIPIELKRSDGDSELYSSLYKLHEIAMELYQENLFSNVGEKSLAYLKERGFEEDIIKQFKIGYALDSWDQLVEACKGKGFTRSQIVQSGLFSQSDKGIFDRFRSRIMFPIFHPSGKPIGFGGRIFGSDQVAFVLSHYHDGIDFELLPAYCNWLCDLSIPKFSIKKSKFVEPYIPNHNIGVMHLAGMVDDRKKDLTYRKIKIIEDSTSISKPIRFEAN